MKDVLNLKLISLQLVAAAFLTAILVDDAMPERMVTHWGSSGQPNGYGNKFVGVWLPPMIMLSVLLLLRLLVKVDPRRGNIEKFMRQWDLFVILLLSFLLYLYWLSLYWNAGNEFDFIPPMIAGLAVLFTGLSRLVAVAEPNFTIGIRTPWTLSDDRVWKKTHRLGGQLFLVSSVIMLGGIIWPAIAVWIILGTVVGTSLTLLVYSYRQFAKLTKPKK